MLGAGGGGEEVSTYLDGWRGRQRRNKVPPESGPCSGRELRLSLRFVISEYSWVAETEEGPPLAPHTCTKAGKTPKGWGGLGVWGKAGGD